jgi:hypothetical protein
MSIKFLSALFGPRSEGNVFVTRLPNVKDGSKGHPRRVTREVESIEKFVAKHDAAGYAIYFCVSTLKPGEVWRNKKNLFEIVCLHADLDFKGIVETRAQIERVLKHLPLRPQLVNFSGNGLHCYWLLDKALLGSDIERVERLLERLADVLAADPAVCHCAALMRLPGSHNTKNGKWTEVVTVTKRKGSYSLDELEEWLTKATPLLRRVANNSGGGGGGAFAAYGASIIVRAPVDVERRLGEMQFQGGGESAIHQTQVSVSAALLNRGWSIDAVVERVLKATVEAAGPEGRGWDWDAEARGIREMCETWLEKHPRVFFTEGD